VPVAVCQPAEAATDEQIRQSPLVIFATERCPYCMEVRRELTTAGVDHAVRIVDAADRAALQLRTGQRTVPYVFANGRFVGGCNDGPESWMGTVKLLRSGALERLLADGTLPAGASDSTAGGLARAVDRRNLALAIGSPLAAAALYFYQRANPFNPIELLRRMERQSLPLPEALANGRGTVIEFYAPWCVSCREMAPHMYRLEKRYGDKVNFVLVDGADPKNSKLVQVFGVDGVPHIDFISRERKMLTTLIGEAPGAMIEANIQGLL